MEYPNATVGGMYWCKKCERYHDSGDYQPCPPDRPSPPVAASLVPECPECGPVCDGHQPVAEPKCRRCGHDYGICLEAPDGCNWNHPTTGSDCDCLGYRPPTTEPVEELSLEQMDAEWGCNISKGDIQCPYMEYRQWESGGTFCRYRQGHPGFHRDAYIHPPHEDQSRWKLNQKFLDEQLAGTRHSPTASPAEPIEDAKALADAFVLAKGNPNVELNGNILRHWMAEFAEQYATKQIERQTPAIEADLKAEIERLRDVLHRDQTGLADGIDRIRKIVKGWAWIPLGEWACYDYTEQTAATLRIEFSNCLRQIEEVALAAMKASGELAHAECCGWTVKARRSVGDEK